MIKTIFFKELRCLFRDKKSFIMGIIFPFFLVMSLLFMTDFSRSLVSKNLSLAVSDKHNAFYVYLKARGDIDLKDAENSNLSVKSSEIVGRFIVDEDLDEKIIKSEDFKISVDYNLLSENSSSVLNELLFIKSDFEKMISGRQFSTKYEIYNFINESIAAVKASENTGGIYLRLLLPVIIIVYASISSSAVAGELSVGEKEKGTLKPLISTGVDRDFIVVGKVLAISFMAFLSVFSAALGFSVYMLFSSADFFAGLSFLHILAVLVILILTILFISSVNFSVGTFSRSLREAQIYFMIASAIFTAPTFFAGLVNPQNVGVIELCVPIFNVICVMSEITSNNFNWLHFLIVAFCLNFYCLAFMKISVKLFSKESIIFRS